jgi:hypothetical protein
VIAPNKGIDSLLDKFVVGKVENTSTMTIITPLEKLTIPLGGQVIELQQLDYAGGGMSLLRTRIRENKRFTVFEIDPQSARVWGEALLRWAQTQAQSQAPMVDES